MINNKHNQPPKSHPLSLPSVPQSWSELSWQQLMQMWTIKTHLSGNADAARAAALLSLWRVVPTRIHNQPADDPRDPSTGETLYPLTDANGTPFHITPRELSLLAVKMIPWFDFPYGDHEDHKDNDKEEQEDADSGDHREHHAGYVSAMRDALILSSSEVFFVGRRFYDAASRSIVVRWLRAVSNIFGRHFLLPSLACNNLSWQQYRALQNISSQLFAEGMSDEEVATTQARFLAHILTPRTFALLDTSGGSIRIRPHWAYNYNSEHSDSLVGWWRKRLLRCYRSRSYRQPLSALPSANVCEVSALYQVCFQAYQTALYYYSAAYPLLFSDKSGSNSVRDALQGEVGTINTVMKYAGYAEQQQVYDSNLPFVLDILNTMTREAKEVEKMNAKMKRR